MELTVHVHILTNPKHSDGKKPFAGVQVVNPKRHRSRAKFWPQATISPAHCLIGYQFSTALSFSTHTLASYRVLVTHLNSHIVNRSWSFSRSCRKLHIRLNSALFSEVLIKSEKSKSAKKPFVSVKRRLCIEEKKKDRFISGKLHCSVFRLPLLFLLCSLLLCLRRRQHFLTSFCLSHPHSLCLIFVLFFTALKL